eukprot:8832065-Ditylum_brightwellii.AAC.1
MQVTVDLMSFKISVAVMGHVEFACATVFTGVVGEADGNRSSLLTVSAQARTRQREGSPDFCMVTVSPIVLFFCRWKVMDTDSERWSWWCVCGRSLRFRKNWMSWSVIVLVRHSAVLPESEYSQDRIAKNRAPMRRIAQAQQSGVMA